MWQNFLTLEWPLMWGGGEKDGVGVVGISEQHPIILFNDTLLPMI